MELLYKDVIKYIDKYIGEAKKIYRKRESVRKDTKDTDVIIQVKNLILRRNIFVYIKNGMLCDVRETYLIEYPNSYYDEEIWLIDRTEDENTINKLIFDYADELLLRRDLKTSLLYEKQEFLKELEE